MKLYYTESYEYLAKKMGIELGNIERGKFADGETHGRFLDNLQGEDVYILGGTISDKEVLDIYDLAYAASRKRAKSINIIIPYFGYSTMEREVNDGDLVKAESRANLLSSIPRSTEINTFYLFDLHAEGISGYFDKDSHAVHMYGKNLLDMVLKDLDNVILASPDAGRVKWVASLAKDNGLDFAICLKQREGEVVKHLAVGDNVKGKNVLIYDDMIRSGSTILEAAKAYKSQGAKKIYVLASHGIFTSDALFKSNLIEKIYVSNSHPNVNKYSDKLEILDISGIIKSYLFD